jgi:hypothetical protein
MPVDDHIRQLEEEIELRKVPMILTRMIGFLDVQLTSAPLNGSSAIWWASFDATR